MAKMRKYRPECEANDECDHRATYEVVGDNGARVLSCGSHVKNVLFQMTKAEGEEAASDPTTKDIRKVG